MNSRSYYRIATGINTLSTIRMTTNITFTNLLILTLGMEIGMPTPPIYFLYIWGYNTLRGDPAKRYYSKRLLVRDSIARARNKVGVMGEIYTFEVKLTFPSCLGKVPLPYGRDLLLTSR